MMDTIQETPKDIPEERIKELKLMAADDAFSYVIVRRWELDLLLGSHEKVEVQKKHLRFERAAYSHMRDRAVAAEAMVKKIVDAIDDGGEVWQVTKDMRRIAGMSAKETDAEGEP